VGTCNATAPPADAAAAAAAAAADEGDEDALAVPPGAANDTDSIYTPEGSPRAQRTLDDMRPEVLAGFEADDWDAAGPPSQQLAPPAASAPAGAAATQSHQDPRALADRFDEAATAPVDGGAAAADDDDDDDDDEFDPTQEEPSPPAAHSTAVPAPVALGGGGGGGGGGGTGGEEAARLRRENAALRRALQDAEDEREQREDQLHAALHSHSQAVRQNGLLQARVAELTDSNVQGRAGADDLSRLVQQLLAVQRQLAAERASRETLTTDAVAAAVERYDAVILRQQDEIAVYADRTGKLEAVFSRMRRGIHTAHDLQDIEGASTRALLAAEASHAEAAHGVSASSLHRTAAKNLFAEALSTPSTTFSYAAEAGGPSQQLPPKRAVLLDAASPMRHGAPVNASLSHSADPGLLRYNLLLDT
jgi:hypothetical protein